jgi:inorganic pyrophosphatase
VPEGKEVEVQGWENQDVAMRLLDEARERAQ